MPASRRRATRIFVREGVMARGWSPRGDLVAFTKQNKGRFTIGVMRLERSENGLADRLLPDEGRHGRQT